MSRRVLVADAGDALLELVREAALTVDPTLEVMGTARVGSAARELANGDVAVLVAGPHLSSPTTLAQLHDVRATSPATSIVLAFGKRPSAPLRDVVRTGACDILAQPFDTAELADALRNALELHDELAGPVSGMIASPAAAAEHGARTGRVLAVASATGGCGKTFFATNLAYFLATKTAKRVCIVDLDLQFGEVSTALRLKPRFTVSDLIGSMREGTPIDQHLEEHLVMHETGIWVLPAPKDPAEADRIEPRDVTAIIDAVSRHFDYVVVDTGGQLAETVLAALDRSELLYIMATLDLPSIRNMGVFLTTLDRLRIPSDTVRLILNKAESDIGLEALEVESLFPQGFTATLPYAKEVHRSINMGSPVLAVSPEALVSRTFIAGVRELLPADQQATIPELAAAPRKTGWLQRIFGSTPATQTAAVMEGARA